jgi:hypothetical protein
MLTALTFVAAVCTSFAHSPVIFFAVVDSLSPHSLTVEASLLHTQSTHIVSNWLVYMLMVYFVISLNAYMIIMLCLV